MKKSVLVNLLVVLIVCMLIPYPGYGRGGGHAGGRGGGFSRGHSGGHSGFTGHHGLHSSNRPSPLTYRPPYSTYRPPYSSYRPSYQPYRHSYAGHRAPFYYWGYRPYRGVYYPWWGLYWSSSYWWDPFYYPYSVAYETYSGGFYDESVFPDTEGFAVPAWGTASNPLAYPDPSYQPNQGTASQGSESLPGEWVQVPGQWVGGIWVPPHTAWAPVNP